jgi:hypothetical protein
MRIDDFDAMMPVAEGIAFAPTTKLPTKDEIRAAKVFGINVIRGDLLHAMLRKKYIEPYAETFGQSDELGTFLAVIDTVVFHTKRTIHLSRLLFHARTFLDLPEDRVEAELAILVENGAIAEGRDGKIILPRRAFGARGKFLQ